MDGQQEHGSTDKRKLSQRTTQRETHLVRCKSNRECFIRTEHQTPTWCPFISKELPHYVSLTRLENQCATMLEVRYPVFTTHPRVRQPHQTVELLPRSVSVCARLHCTDTALGEPHSLFLALSPHVSPEFARLTSKHAGAAHTP